MGLIFSKCISLCLSISPFKVVLACAPVLIELASGTSLLFQLLTCYLMQFVCRPWPTDFSLLRCFTLASSLSPCVPSGLTQLSWAPVNIVSPGPQIPISCL